LFMTVVTTDPTDSVQWRCEVAGGFADITFDNPYGASCSPVTSINAPILVYAIVTDTSGQSIRSEQRIYRMLPRGPN
ncbi:MAG TPA: hypothetical protein VNA17_09340, partial [Pyrinomonadaceae bacterium]|nr:hypothetical protein [Pyrinomonadaceae bacterium]